MNSFDTPLPRTARQEMTPHSAPPGGEVLATQQVWKSGEPLPHVDLQQAERSALLRDLGLHGPEQDLDAFASQLAQEAGTPFAMVNIFGVEQEFFGLYAADGDSDLPVISRSMPLDHGYCPTVVATRKSLVLWDVYASSRFASNPVVDLIGIRNYTGAPLIVFGVVLGSICTVDVDPHLLSTAREDQKRIKHRAAELSNTLGQRAQLRP